MEKPGAEGDDDRKELINLFTSTRPRSWLGGMKTAWGWRNGQAANLFMRIFVSVCRFSALSFWCSSASSSQDESSCLVGEQGLRSSWVLVRARPSLNCCYRFCGWEGFGRYFFFAVRSFEGLFFRFRFMTCWVALLHAVDAQRSRLLKSWQNPNFQTGF